MKAIVCEKPGLLKAIEKEKPTPQPGESLLRIKRIGICGTDLHAYAGNQPFFSYPRILGHELSAEIVEINGARHNLETGQAVIIIPYIHCGHCVACQQDKTNCCTSLKVFGIHMDGGMQEYVTYPTELLMAAEGLSLEAMAIVEPLCIGWHAVERAAIGKGDWVVVSGCGPIGVGLIWAAQQQGAQVIAIDTNEDRLTFCKSHFSVDHCIVAGPKAVDQVKALTGGDLTRVAFDATGIKQAMEAGIEYVGAGGKYVLVGLYKGALSFEHPAIHARELSVLCSRNATKNDFKAVTAAMRTTSFPTEAYVTHQSAAAEVPQQFDFWKNPQNQVMKAMAIF